MKVAVFGLLMIFALRANSQRTLELNQNWVCKKVREVSSDGQKLSLSATKLENWIPAKVPGTVIGTLMRNGLVPDPYLGTNLKQIPDLFTTGPDEFSYWFVNDFNWKPTTGRFINLNFRGINYSFELWVNGIKLPTPSRQSMFLRQSFDITKYLKASGSQRIALKVLPPPIPGNPNGGQGGDGQIGRNVGMQFTAGWDWIQAIPDRNTGIWDKVTVEETGAMRILDPVVETMVEGKRYPNDKGGRVSLNVRYSLQNLSNKSQTGTVSFNYLKNEVKQTITLKPFQKLDTSFRSLILSLPGNELWWPTGLGGATLQQANLQVNKMPAQALSFGVRTVTHNWNEKTNSAQFFVNGQRLFLKGGNWIASDAFLDLSKERYRKELIYHKRMNLNMIRVWGGSMVERPEFYDLCDSLGLLVWQDLWMTGDCNGRWLDPLKKDDQQTRRGYPDDHELLKLTIEDQIKMIRNHPSLALWCGGNEITPPEDILQWLNKVALPQLDSTRPFFDFSNSSSLSNNPSGYNGDGPYSLQPVEYFWQHRGFGLNSEMGSVGIGELESLKRFLPTEALVIPRMTEGREEPDSVWTFHKYAGVGYGESVNTYGKPTTLEQYCSRAQLVNYEQYRALMEGYISHMWDWYTGLLVWKTQNPWTAMRGEMYDHHLQPNAGLYALRKAGEEVHIMYNPVTGEVSAANHGLDTRSNLRMTATLHEPTGKSTALNETYISLAPGRVEHFSSLQMAIGKLGIRSTSLLNLQLRDSQDSVISSNTYWLKNSNGTYEGLENFGLPQLELQQQKAGNQLEVIIKNTGAKPGFFLRLELVNVIDASWASSADENYFSIMPGEKLILHYEHLQAGADLQLLLRNAFGASKTLAQAVN